jgi:hypothetical protein
MRPRSEYGSCIVVTDVPIDEWLQSPPSPRRVRPTHCPCCQAAAWIDGTRLRILGHGRRSRSVISQATSTSDALNHQFPGRRFRCAVDGCGAVMLAVPAGVLPKRRFSGPSIAFAIALFGHALASAGSVRRRLAPSTCGGDVWRQLRRWVRSAVEDRLFRLSRRFDARLPWRSLAAHIGSMLAGDAPPGARGGSIASQAFAARAALG